jgi:hypothetical protein
MMLCIIFALVIMSMSIQKHWFFSQSQHKNQCWHNKQIVGNIYYNYLPTINEKTSNDFETNTHQNMGPQFSKEP